MADPTLVSILIPIFNREHRIEETLTSLKAQTYTNWECVLVDDGSTDNTWKVLEQLAGSDTRIRCFKRLEDRPKGANACRNIAFEKSRGSLVNWFDSDDILLPNFIERKLEALQAAAQEVPVVFCESQTFAMRDGQVEILQYFPIKYDDFYEDFILRRFQLSMPAGLWRKSYVHDRFGVQPFDEQITQSQDYDFYFRVFQESFDFEIVHEPLFNYRKEDVSISSDFMSRKPEHLRSFLVVRQKILRAHADQPELFRGVLNQVAASLRTALVAKAYPQAQQFLEFLEKETEGTAYATQVRRMKKYYRLCKLLGGGVTRFKDKFVFT